ncbi:ABC transporter substrate-binding protein [Tepidibacter formicigenes]|uniref:Peptide/nickel transport system substrate-binding protein n=1 Tax=Tepidibacter formicigenes DSM 15518 TaxID=1123349 RepID=A0A1M6K557_9FIRM|nr:peptide ABC transporter substrate-binding protein [Tepidibacter formicigenes]SHJ54000.1 peptide/nickel transport system substrate-binding protein [Tepidibacter formicigenes DSM 15518]
MKKLRIIFLLITIIFLFGCSADDKELNSHLEKANLQPENLIPKEGGKISISVVEFKTLNPLLNKEKSLDQALKLVYDSLFTLDENYNIVSKLVDNYSFLDDGMILNINLKDNITWHDGVKLTSQDVKFTVGLLKTLSESPYYPLVSNIYSVDIVSDNSFNIVFTKPYSFSLENLIFPILPNHKLYGQSIDNIKLDENNLIGSGMYKINKYEKRKYIDLVKNENYYDEKPYIDEIRMVIVPDKEAQESMLISLETDICEVDQIISGKFPTKRFDSKKYRGQDYEFLALNFNNEYIKDINLRKAIAYIIDREKILKEVYLKKGEIVEFPLNSNSKYYNKNIKNYNHNLDKAKEYLDKTQFQDIKFTLIVDQTNFERLKTAYIIKEQLENLNIKLEVLELSWEDILNRLRTGEYDLALLGWKLPIVPDPTFALYPNNVTNFTNYVDPNMDILVQNLLSSVKEEDKIKNYYELQKYIKENLPFISLLVKDENLVLNNKIKGRLNSNDFNIYNGIENIFVNY